MVCDGHQEVNQVSSKRWFCAVKQQYPLLTATSDVAPPPPTLICLFQAWLCAEKHSPFVSDAFTHNSWRYYLV